MVTTRIRKDNHMHIQPTEVPYNLAAITTCTLSAMEVI